MRKTLICVTVLLAILFPVASMAATDEQVKAADALHAFGLFQGVGTDVYGKPIYNLDGKLTRSEGVAMFVRLLGEEANALREDVSALPFKDVPSWAKPYVAFAYRNGLVKGFSADVFGGHNEMTAAQYLTLIARALGYRDGVDFTYENVWYLTDGLRISDGRFDDLKDALTRGDVTEVSLRALYANERDAEITLLEQLVRKGAVKLDGAGQELPQPEDPAKNPAEVFAKKVFELTNKERTAAGLAPLAWNDKLFEAAQIRANEITKQFSHTRPNGSGYHTALSDVGITGSAMSGENIAAGQRTPEEVINGWMDSPGHKANILRDGFDGFAAGVAYTDKYYWVQLFIKESW
ncbi:MAG: CAP domain-containing protein [Clostridiales Family XIII bacterium]|jgi:hypothetical protein|nr:CAP domain-containing protein [Clostridiales Family XIII bacterium]